MTTNRDEFLDRLFGMYREVLGEFEPTPAFVAKVWAKIDSRRRERASWASYLIAWSPRLAIASFAVAALLVASQWMPIGNESDSALLDSSYVDVLALDSMDEQDEALWVLAENGK
jgi:hypothetical protein